MTLRDLVALTTLPALWVGRDPLHILAGMLDVLVRMLGLDVAYARLSDATLEHGSIHAARAPRGTTWDRSAADVARALAPGLTSESGLRPSTVSQRERGDGFALLVTPFGVAGTRGLLAAGAERPGFPSDLDRLLLEVAASQVLVAMQGALLTAERRQHADELGKREERYRSLVGATASIVWTTSADGIFSEPQPGWEAYTGQRWPECRDTGWIDKFHPDDRAAFRAGWQAAVGACAPWESRARLWHVESASYRHVVARAAPVRDEDGSVREWVGTITDVHERHAAESALRDSERVRLTLLHSLRGAVYRCRASGDWPIEYLSEGVVELTGYPASEFLGPSPPRLFTRLMHRDDRAQVWREVRNAIAEQRPWENVFRLRTDTGEEKWVLDRGRPVYGEGRELVALEGFLTDITDRKRAEERLREETDALETVNCLGRMLTAELELDALMQAVTDAATRLTHAAYGAFFSSVRGERSDAETLCAVCGIPQTGPTRFPMPDTPLFAMTFRDRAVVRLDDVTKHPRYGRQAPHHGMPPGHVAVRSYLAVPVVSRSGDTLGALFFAHPSVGVFTERDERMAVAVAAYAAVAIDNARLYERARRARADAEAANRSKDEFLATLSHELRTPLNAVVGWTAVLRRAHLTAATRDRAVEAIERNARVQAQLIEDLLDISRIAAGKLHLDRRLLDPAAVIEAALDAVRPAAESGRLVLAVDLERHAGPVPGDPSRLQQVVWNLVSNAVKFTPAGGRVEVRLRRVDRHAEIVVSDTGAGIAADILPYVFDRFRQGDSSSTRKHGGLGIGLALVKHLVEAHGGTVQAHSDGPGRGARFTVTLPRDASRDGPQR